MSHEEVNDPYQNKPEKVKKTRSTRKINPAGETKIEEVEHNEELPVEIKKEVAYSVAKKDAPKRPMSDKQKENIAKLVEKNKIRFGMKKQEKEQAKAKLELEEKVRLECEAKENEKREKKKLVKMTTVIKPKRLYKKKEKVFKVDNKVEDTTADEETEPTTGGEISEDSRTVRRLAKKVQKINNVLQSVPESRPTNHFENALRNVF